jgi:hypothetical protein
MEFFAASGCDHVMVDMPDSAPSTFQGRYDTIGAAIASSSNPNMVYGVWCSSSHPERWAPQARAPPNGQRPAELTTPRPTA